MSPEEKDRIKQRFLALPDTAKGQLFAAIFLAMLDTKPEYLLEMVEVFEKARPQVTEKKTPGKGMN